MKDFPNKNLKDAKRDQLQQIRALYDAAPYPDILTGKMPSHTPMLSHWINAVVAPNPPALHSTANILVAGCGSGEEAFMLAKQFPEAQIVGVDFSHRSILRAQEHAATINIPNVTFEVADLTSMEWTKKHPSFDFTSCHGVADFILDASALMQTFANCLTQHGVVCMTVNSPHHPAKKIKEAFSELGISPDLFNDSPEQRELLKIMVNLMGSNAGINDLGNAPKAYLDVDIFPPIAHHDSIGTWAQRAQKAGLSFCGSMDALLGLIPLTDEQLPLLYQLGRAELSIWMARLRQRPGMQLLFSPQKPIEPNFFQPDKIWSWTPNLATCVGTLPPLTGAPNQPRPMTLQFPELPNFIINSSAYDLEVLRRCNGSRSLGEVIKTIPVEGNLELLKASLFRAYHYGILVN